MPNEADAAWKHCVSLTELDYTTIMIPPGHNSAAGVSSCFGMKTPGPGSFQILSVLQGRQAAEGKRGIPSLVSWITCACKEHPEEVIVNYT